MLRIVWILSLAGWLCSFTASADVIIFTDGSRMEVRSYEVREGLVLITTIEGKLQSVPRTYVNLEATQRANRGGEVSTAPRVEPSAPPRPPQPPAAAPVRDEPPQPPSGRPRPPSAESARPPAAATPPPPSIPPPVWADEELKVSVVIPSAVWRVETQSASYDVAVRLDNPQTGVRATLALVRQRMRDYGDFLDVVREIEASVTSSGAVQSLGSGALSLDPYTAYQIQYTKSIDGAVYYNRIVVYYSRDLAYVLSMSCPQEKLETSRADMEELVKGVVIKKVRKDITPKGAPSR